jgi:predicted ATPase
MLKAYGVVSHMKFRTLPPRQRPGFNATNGIYLEANSWNDFGYTTLWTMHYVHDGHTTEVGSVKIGDFAGSDHPQPPRSFTQIPTDFFSLGQDEDYYEKVKLLGEQNRVTILRDIRDIAFNADLFEEVKDLEITRNSLMRSLTPVAVQTQFRRIASGGVKLSPYAFSYFSSDTDRQGNIIPRCRLDFEVQPNSKPRSNIHVIIGRNGVGKSFILNDIATSLTYQKNSDGYVQFQQSSNRLLTQRFANVVSVAFSAFDAFEPLRQSEAKDATKHHYIGLKRTAPSSSVKDPGLKNHVTLAQDFGRSFKKLLDTRRLVRWQHYINFLDTDMIFAKAIRQITDTEAVDLRENARELFGGLSSGHQIVLLTVTRLVETVEEGSLVLFDEPETHLHPPLVSALMRTLAELLEDRNAVAIIATHSPVVAQEVPSICVTKIAGSGGALTATRPTIETYGENVGTLTQEIFGLEVATSGFHLALDEAVKRGSSFEEIASAFNNRLGAEARALLRSMVYLDGLD